LISGNGASAMTPEAAADVPLENAWQNAEGRHRTLQNLQRRSSTFVAEKATQEIRVLSFASAAYALRASDSQRITDTSGA
jgi:hypothetical protein